MTHRLVQKFTALCSIAIFCFALWTVSSVLEQHSLDDISRSLRQTPWGPIVAATGLTLLSYAFLAGSDILAAHYARIRLRFLQIALASFISQAIAHSTGFGALTGSAIRYRLYSSSGISALTVAKIVAFCAVTFTLGIALSLTLAVVFESDRIAASIGVPPALLALPALITATMVVGYILWCTIIRKPLHFSGWHFVTPSPRIALCQLVLALADLLTAGGALYVLLPDMGSIGFLAFMGLYAAALSIGVISQVPGGLGVFEGSMLLFLSFLPADQVLGALLINRVIYNLIPLCGATAMLGVTELCLRARPFKGQIQRLTSTMRSLSPGLFAVMALISGGILLFSGATPSVEWRRLALNDWIPLPLIELSHLLGSVAGILLIILARGLFRRLDAAYFLTVVLLATGVVLSLLKGFDYEESFVLAAILALFIPTRPAFYRHASLFAGRLRPMWIASVVIAIATAAGLTFFSFKHVEYSRQLWWEFTLSEDAPRSLRALVAVTVVMLAYAAANLLRPIQPRPGRPSPEEMAKIRPIIAASPSTESSLALLGDKSFLFSPKEESFLMYTMSGKSWIVMGDPVGPEEDWPDLIWSLCELADLHGGRPVFYQINADSLPLYLDLGMSFIKLGEEARVFLPDFSLQGPQRRELRYTHGRALREGATLDIITGEHVDDILPELHGISDEWLTMKKTREKRFSLGRFDSDYLRNFSIAVVRRQGRIVAFANLWLSAGSKEMAVDLMRYSKDGGYGIMDYLFTELMLRGHDMGYQWFSLGLAPLSGFRRLRRGPLWGRIGSFIFHHGENFYNFKGIRSYKEKFNPVWRPRFMAVPNGLALPRAVADTASLIAGGVRGLVAK